MSDPSLFQGWQYTLCDPSGKDFLKTVFNFPGCDSKIAWFSVV